MSPNQEGEGGKKEKGTQAPKDARKRKKRSGFIPGRQPWVRRGGHRQSNPRGSFYANSCLKMHSRGVGVRDTGTRFLSEGPAVPQVSALASGPPRPSIPNPRLVSRPSHSPKRHRPGRTKGSEGAASARVPGEPRWASAGWAAGACASLSGRRREGEGEGAGARPRETPPRAAQAPRRARGARREARPPSTLGHAGPSGGRRGPAGPRASRERRARVLRQKVPEQPPHRRAPPWPGWGRRLRPAPPGPPPTPGAPPRRRARLPQAEWGARSLGEVSLGLTLKEGVSGFAGSARFSNLRRDAFPGAGSESGARGKEPRGRSAERPKGAGQSRREQTGDAWCLVRGLNRQPRVPELGHRGGWR